MHTHNRYKIQLHWLPIRQRISFKLFRCLRGEAPPYLTEMLSLVSDSDALRSHRSAARGDLIIPRTFTKTFGPRGFAVSGPTAGHSLPAYLKDKDLSPAIFRSKLKTHFFSITPEQISKIPSVTFPKIFSRTGLFNTPRSYGFFYPQRGIFDAIL